MILAAFVSGAIIGLYFHRDDFLGGYTSFPRRILRLGHISLAALGIINILFSLAPLPSEPSWRAQTASMGFIVGGLTMPSVCFLSAWRKGLRHLFFVPVTALIVAGIFTLRIVGG
jgi:hypothetical protein